MVCLVSGIPFDESRMTKHWTVVRKIGKNGHKFFINLGQKKTHFTPVSEGLTLVQSFKIRVRTSEFWDCFLISF